MGRRRELKPGDTTRVRWCTEPVPEFGDILHWTSSNRTLQVVEVRGRKTLVCTPADDADVMRALDDGLRWWDCFYLSSRRKG